MSLGNRRKAYSTQEALNLVLNDSDSEGIVYESDSDISFNEFSDEISENSSQTTDETLHPSESSGTPDSSDSDGESEPYARPVPVMPRNQGRNARARRPQRGRGLHRRNLVERNGANNPVNRERENHEWEWYEPMDPYTSDWLPHFRGRRGVLVDTTDFNPVDYFQLFFPHEAFQLITLETNRYAEQYLARHAENLPPFSRFRQWEQTDTAEIKAYIALQICMGMCKKNEIEDYWSKFRLTRTAFSAIMPRNRYELLTSFLHFSNNETPRPEKGSPDYDPLWKIRDLMNICEATYPRVYGPDRDISIDESLIRFKGRVWFKQYLPAKPYKWGLKQFAVCESKTGYALKFLTYTGKGSVENHDGFSITESICLSLLEGMYGVGHKVFTDNFYSSPALFRELQRRGIGATGTVKAGRKGMPAELHPNNLKLQKGDDPVFQRSGDLIACAWQDTKRVTFLSTTETNNTIDKQIRQRGAEGGYRVIEKPVVAEVYNDNMGGVDLLDQKLCTFGYPHKSVKWYNTIYHRLMEVALINGYIVYKHDYPDSKLIPKLFRESVVDGLLEGFEQKTKRKGRPSVESVSRLTERHFVGQFENPKYKPDCVVCSSRSTPGWSRKQTNFKCKKCDLPMCIIPCFEIFHTKKNFKQEVARVVYNL